MSLDRACEKRRGQGSRKVVRLSREEREPEVLLRLCKIALGDKALRKALKTESSLFSTSWPQSSRAQGKQLGKISSLKLKA